MNFDIAVIGGGPGGYVAAIRASQLGLKVAIIEKEGLGGICLNWGCIPTKALLNAAHAYHNVTHKYSDFGIHVENVSFDITKIVKYSREKSKKLSQGIEYLMNKNNITYYKGRAAINPDKTISVDNNKTISAKNIIIATGSTPKSIPTLEFDHQMIWDYRDAMTPEKLPKSMLIIGAGAIGIEFASFYNALGVKVVVVESKGQILPAEDIEIADIARKEFEKRGMKIYTDSTISNLKRGKKEVTLKINSDEITVEKIIVAVGVKGNYDDFGLNHFSKIQVKNHFILTDDFGFTGEKGVYAIGDVTGPPCLAHKASHEGVLCVEKIAGKNSIAAIKDIPGCTYCDPQIASIGLTEKEAKNLGYEIKIGRFKPDGNGKAVVLDEKVGLVKTIFDKTTGELLGAHMIGAEVTEMIQGYIIGKTLEATDEDFKHTIFPHPTLSEMMHESVLDADGDALHS